MLQSAAWNLRLPPTYHYPIISGITLENEWTSLARDYAQHGSGVCLRKTIWRRLQGCGLSPSRVSRTDTMYPSHAQAPFASWQQPFVSPQLGFLREILQRTPIAFRGTNLV